MAPTSVTLFPIPMTSVCYGVRRVRRPSYRDHQLSLSVAVFSQAIGLRWQGPRWLADQRHHAIPDWLALQRCSRNDYAGVGLDSNFGCGVNGQ